MRTNDANVSERTKPELVYARGAMSGTAATRTTNEMWRIWGPGNVRATIIGLIKRDMVSCRYRRQESNDEWVR